MRAMERRDNGRGGGQRLHAAHDVSRLDQLSPPARARAVVCYERLENFDVGGAKRPETSAIERGLDMAFGKVSRCIHDLVEAQTNKLMHPADVTDAVD
jgi:hypothetical protein